MSSFVGRDIKVPESYYDDMSDQDVPAGYEYVTKVTKYTRRTKLFSFTDEWGHPNNIFKADVVKFLVPLNSTVGASSSAAAAAAPIPAAANNL